MIAATASLVKKLVRVLSRTWLFLFCFLPAVSMIGSATERFFRSGFALPERTEAAGFIAALAGTSALAVSLRRSMKARWTAPFVTVGLFAAIALFASSIFDLYVCQTNEVEDFGCVSILDALLWSAAILVGLLALLLSSAPVNKEKNPTERKEEFLILPDMNAAFPALFLSHGSPMMALETPENDPYVRTLREIGERLPKPKAAVFISAHWYARGKFVDVSKRPRTLYDFAGFPRPLYAITYPCPGYPEVAKDLDAAFGEGVWKPTERGLDHGVWSTLVHLFPKADVPVVTLSLDAESSPKEHFETGRKLAGLRRAGYLVIASGNLVHDLSSADFSKGPGTEPHPFGKEFDSAFAKAVESGDMETLFEPMKMPGGIRSAPTPEHYLPALVALGTAAEGEGVEWLYEGFELGSIGRRAFMVGAITGSRETVDNGEISP